MNFKNYARELKDWTEQKKCVVKDVLPFYERLRWWDPSPLTLSSFLFGDLVQHRFTRKKIKYKKEAIQSPCCGKSIPEEGVGIAFPRIRKSGSPKLSLAEIMVDDIKGRKLWHESQVTNPTYITQYMVQKTWPTFTWVGL